MLVALDFFMFMPPTLGVQKLTWSGLNGVSERDV